jgi:hypothetical protein
MKCPYEETCLHKTDDCKEDFMNITTKVLIPNKEWIIEDNRVKIGSIAKNKKGYSFLRNGQAIVFKNITQIQQELGITLLDSSPTNFEMEPASYAIYDYPCSSKPYEPVYNVKKKLPLFAKSDNSKSQYCAGYYIIKFKKGWVKSFCPKLITLERYPFHGPYRTEIEMKQTLIAANKT